MNWTVSRNGGPAQTLAGLGVSQITLNRRSFGLDELVFVVDRTDELAAPIFAWGDTIALVADGVTRFQGAIRSDATVEGDQKRQQIYGAWNVWDDLKCTTYQQVRTITDSASGGQSAIRTSAVTLFRSPAYNGTGWDSWTVATQLNDILNYALAQGVAFQKDVNITPNLYAPWAEGIDLGCSAALLRCQGQMVDLVSWCDYTTTPPTIHFRRRSNQPVASLDLTDGTKVLRIDNLRQRGDLVPRGIRFIFLTTVKNAAGASYIIINETVAGATTGPRVIVNTIDLTALENSIANYVDPPDGIPAVAADYFATLTTPWFDGQITLQQAECNGAFSPGQKVQFIHGRPDWSADGAIIQAVSEELMSGITTLRFGPPPVMPVAQFITAALMQSSSKKTSITGVAASTGSVASTPTGASTQIGNALMGGGAQTVELCDGTLVHVIGEAPTGS